MADADLLFEWANESRAWSRSTAAITPQEHARWMTFNVLAGHPAHIVVMGEADIGSVGAIRFDMDERDVMTFRVSITIGSAYRGRGFGYELLDQGCTLMQENRLFAEIRSSNAVSRKIFEKCGFEKVSRSSDFVQYRREPRSCI